MCYLLVAFLIIRQPLRSTRTYTLLPYTTLFRTHFASLEEIEKRFATNERRRSLFKGITEVAETLRRAGCRVMFLDGSFVTDKELPEDFDGCWDANGVNATALDPVLLDFEDSRARQKEIGRASCRERGCQYV